MDIAFKKICLIGPYSDILVNEVNVHITINYLDSDMKIDDSKDFTYQAEGCNIIGNMNTPLSLYINTERKRLGWSIRELARRASISHGCLSNILRQKSIPGTTTVEKIADALETDQAKLLQLLAQSRPHPVADANIDPGAAYIARRLSELPDDIRALTIDAVGAHVDNIYNIIQHRPA